VARTSTHIRGKEIAMTAEVLRMIERLIVAGGGALAVYLGYALFKVVPLKSESGVTLKSAIVNIACTKVGLGVIFAAFGMFVLVSDLRSTITVSDDAAQQALSDSALVMKQQRDALTDLSKAIGELQNTADKEKLGKLVERLQTLQAVQGRGLFQFWGAVRPEDDHSVANGLIQG